MKASFLPRAAAVLSIAAAIAPWSSAQSEHVKVQTDRDRLIGTWHLVKIDSPTPDGRPQPPLPIGLFIFTADGYQAVQLMYPKEASTLNNKFVHDGYEASFGTFEVDEAKHLLHYHPVASATRDAFIGTEEVLRPTFPDPKHLVMRPDDPDQHWSVTWERY
jgi:Lipocalin-like domain